jgi:hypothetical protein
MMTFRPSPALASTALGVAVVIVLSGCRTYSHTARRVSREPTFENIWPAKAGNYWAYDLSSQVFAIADTLYSQSAEVPEAPGMDVLYAALGKPFGATAEARGSGTLHVRFGRDISHSTAAVAMQVGVRCERISGALVPPQSFSGQMWTRSGSTIKLFGSGDCNWVYFDESLQLGHEIQDAQIGGFMNLKSRVWRKRSYLALGTEYVNCIECFYVLDMGVTRLGAAGDTPRYCRPYTYGVIVYAPDLGPVYCHEVMKSVGGHWYDSEATISAFANTKSWPAVFAEQGGDPCPYGR